MCGERRVDLMGAHAMTVIRDHNCAHGARLDDTSKLNCDAMRVCVEGVPNQLRKGNFRRCLGMEQDILISRHQ